MVALYALLLQAFLGTLLPSVPALSATATLCAHEDAGPQADHDCRLHACCIAVQAAGMVRSPTSDFAPVAWTERRDTQVRWSAADLAQARAPPDRSVSARGPPTV